MNKAADLVEQAKKMAQEATTWADLFNALYDPLEGILVLAFPSQEEKSVFVKSEEFKQIQAILQETMRRTGRSEGATPTRITKFMVQFHMPFDANGKPDLKNFILTSKQEKEQLPDSQLSQRQNGTAQSGPLGQIPQSGLESPEAAK